MFRCFPVQPDNCFAVIFSLSLVNCFTIVSPQFHRNLTITDTGHDPYTGQPYKEDSSDAENEEKQAEET